MSKEELIKLVKNKLYFAKKRLKDLEKLNNGDLARADPWDRQQLFQEFFFHLVGTVDYLAQIINIEKELSIGVEDVGVKTVCEEIDKKYPNNPISVILQQLHPSTRSNKPLPQDPYSEEGCHFRIIQYRNIVTHNKNFPFRIKVDLQRGIRTVHLIFYPKNPNWLLDKNDPNSNSSEKPIIDEMYCFWEFVNVKCDSIIGMLYK